MLPENDRVLMVMIYVQGMALKEIAKLLEVTESWGSLLHSRVTSGKSRSQRCSSDDHLRAVGGALEALQTRGTAAPKKGVARTRQPQRVWTPSTLRLRP